MKINASLVAGLLASVVMVHASAQPAETAAPPVTASMLGAGLYLMSGGGGANSSVLIGNEGILVVDSKLNTASATQEVAAIAGLSSGAIRYLVNTHVHPDHTGGNVVYGELGAIIIAQAETRAILAAGQRGGPPEPAAALPVITFSGTPLTIHLSGETIVVRPMPGAHTMDNSLVQYTNANVFHLGDIYSASRYPVIAGGTLQGFMDSTGLLLEMANAETRFIPGNGDVAGIEDVRNYQTMLLTVRDRISRLVADGKSLEEVIAARPTAEFDASWGSPERFIPAAYNELKDANQRQAAN